MSYQTKIKKLPKSEAELEVTLPANLLEEARKKALQMFQTSLKIDGFREGKVPENIVIEKVGEATLLEEAADLLLKEHFPLILTEQKLDAIGRPQIAVLKLALGNPFEFKATFALLPEFELPEYKEVASRIQKLESSKEKKIEASEKEIDEVLLQIRRNKAHFDYHQANPDKKGHDPARLGSESVSGRHPEIKDEDLPALDDELARAAGNFQTVDELKAKIKENIEIEKKHREVEKTRALIMEDLLKNTKLELPEILVESEINKSVAQMKDDVARMSAGTGAGWEEYLKHTKKTEEDLRKDLRDSSEKKAKIQLIFNKIAEVEKIEVDKNILENEVKNILEHYKDASEQNARVYVATMLQNSAVLKLLES